MKDLNLLVVEGNLQKENATFKQSGIPFCQESVSLPSQNEYQRNITYNVFLILKIVFCLCQL